MISPSNRCMSAPVQRKVGCKLRLCGGFTTGLMNITGVGVSYELDQNKELRAECATPGCRSIYRRGFAMVRWLALGRLN
jgi:hypothetical protein